MGHERHLGNPSAHVYRYRRSTRLFFAFILVIVVCALTSSAWTHDRFPLVVLGVVTPLYIWILARFNSLQIVVAPDGITYYAATYTLYARWQDVAGIGKAPQPYQGWGDGLLLSDYVWWPSGFWGRFRRQAPGYIPIHLSSGGSSWDDGLDEELRRCVPGLFAPSQQPATA